MSWFPEQQISNSWLHRICVRILKSGPIPKHVAFIMDGNRRFAVKNSMDRADGHLKGFDKLAQTLDWCLNLGIAEVTVYAFSIENFKRSKDEVNCLMELARQKFARLLDEKDMLKKHDVCVRVLGNLSLLTSDIQELIAEAVYLTKNHTRTVLNVCFSYSSRDEISNAMKELAEGVDLGLIQPSDVSEELMSKCLYTSHSEDPALLIRTSGEIRLSDFLLWQSRFSCLAFVEILWPEFSVWHLYSAILYYQKSHHKLQIAKSTHEAELDRVQREADYKCVLEEVEREKQQYGTCNSSIQSKVQQYTTARKDRQLTFLKYVENKRSKYFDDHIARKSIS